MQQYYLPVVPRKRLMRVTSPGSTFRHTGVKGKIDGILELEIAEMK